MIDTSKNTWNFGAELRRLTRGKNTKLVWSRSYARLETAIRRASELMVIDGEVGDVIEIFYKTTGLQLGTLRMTARGTVEMTWVDKWVVRPAKQPAAKPRMPVQEALSRELLQHLRGSVH